MFGFQKLPAVYIVPHSFDECLLRLNGSTDNQTLPQFFHPNLTVRVKTNARSVTISSQRFSKEPVTVFTAQFVGRSAPVTLSGYYRISFGSRIFSSFGLLITFVIGGGMTLFLTYAAIFATWSSGGEARFFLPLIPLAFTVGMLCFLNYLSKPSTGIIESFLAEAIGASIIKESEQAGGVNAAALPGSP